MESINKFISLSYDLSIKGEDGKLALYERAPKEKPFQFITGIGYTLDIFEDNVKDLNVDDAFDFTIPADKAYGEYDKANVIELQKSIFTRDGVFDDEHVKEGYVIPLSDGQSTFNALVTEIREDIVVVDLNHPLAGESLTFVGKIIESRTATAEEVEAAKQPAGCNCGCEDCGSNDGEGCEGKEGCGCNNCH